MKQAKRLLALLMSIALCVSFAACSSDTSGDGDDATDSTYTEIVNEDTVSEEITLRVYQSGSTVEAMVYGTFVEDFLEVASKMDDCQLSVDFETEDGIVFCFNAFSSDGYVSGYYYNFGTEDGDSIDVLYGTSAISFLLPNYTGDFSEIEFSYVYRFEGDEYVDGDFFEIATVMTDESFFNGGSSDDGEDAQLDADTDQNVEDSTAQDFFEAFEGDYYVYNNANYTLPLTVTSENAGEIIYTDIAFFHNDYTYHTRFSVDDLVATDYGDTCIVFTKDEDNVIACFMLNGSTPYVSIYINYSDGDTGAVAVYDYKREDQITTVDEAFVSEYMGEYLDIESGADLCNLGLYNGGYLGYKDVDGVTYTVDTILGAELVNGNQVNVTLIAADGTTFDARIWFGYNGGALRANVNGGWTMEAIN